MNSSEEFGKVQKRIEQMEKEFESKNKNIQEQEKKFKEIDEKLQQKYENDENSTIKLNVGGREFKTLIKTLISIKDTLFYRLIGNAIETGKNLPETVFIDRSFSHFELVLNFMKYKQISLKGYNKLEREDICNELDYYGLEEEALGKKNKASIDLQWDPNLSKVNVFTLDSDKKVCTIKSTTCYTHFVMNKEFEEEDFELNLEVAVSQTDAFLYVGIYNESYITANNCGCCNPKNAWYVQCNGTIHDNGKSITESRIKWNSEKINIVIKGYVSDANDKKHVIFCFPDKGDLELGPYYLNGKKFRPYVGHCNKGNGQVTIVDCISI